MEDIYYEEIWELVSKIIDKIRHANDDDYSVGIIAKYPEAKELIKEFIMCDADIDTIDLENPEVEGYEDEYYIGVDMFNGEISVCCYPLKDDEDYYDIYNNIVYIFGDCCSRAYNHCEADEIHAVYIGEECDCYNCDESCKCKCHEEDESDFAIKVICTLGIEKANKILDEIENKTFRISNAFDKINYIKRFLG